MENYEIVLLSDSQGAVLTAKQITLGFQGANTMTTGTMPGNLTEGNLTVDAVQVSVLRDGSEVSGRMKTVAVRCAELEESIANIQDNEKKSYATAKLAVWKTFNNSLQTALTKALKAQYLLDNPLKTV